jgi:sigma-B regulation protein RsbU (phosphoserine phosphatase)
MSEEEAKSTYAQSEQKLICAGIWGGIHNLNQDIMAGAVEVSLYSSSSDGGKGGDIYYFGVCKNEMITRVAIADVVGHGQAVADVSQYVYDSLRAHMCDPDSGKILAQINRLSSQRGLKAMTTAAVVAYHGVKGEFSFSYAGHPPVLFKRANEKVWSECLLANEGDRGSGSEMNLPLAVTPETLYNQQVIPVSSGDRLLVYTDGLTEATSKKGELFGTERLCDVLNANADLSLSQLKSAILQGVGRHTGNGLTHDDVTLIAMEIG